MNTIYILWLRQITRYRRSRARMLTSLTQPLMFFLAFGFGFGSVYQKAGGGDYIQFLAPGIIAMTVMTSAVLSGIDLIWDKQFGFLKETLVAPVSRTTIMFGRTLGAATVSFFQGFLVFVFTVIIGFRPENYLLVPLAFLFMILIAFLFTALGTAIASVVSDMHAFPLVMNFLVMPLFFLSGALFPLHDLPLALKILNRIDPLTYGVDGMRYFLINISSFSPVLDLAVLLVFIFFIMTIGVALFRRIEA